jgi:hypothetical protein
MWPVLLVNPNSLWIVKKEWILTVGNSLKRGWGTGALQV